MNPIYIPCDNNDMYVCDITNKIKYKKPLTCYKCKHLIWQLYNKCPSCNFNYWTRKPKPKLSHFKRKYKINKYQKIEDVICFKMYFNQAPESFRNTLHYKILKYQKIKEVLIKHLNYINKIKN